MLKKFLFIDRDGTLIHEPKDNFQIDHVDKFFLEPDVIPSLLTLKRFNYHFIMITNQDNLGSLEYSIEKFKVIQNLLLNIFFSQNIFFEAILICPHVLSDCCQCRKPNTKLVEFWLNSSFLDKNNSYVIGDRDTDIKFSKNMGIKSFLYNKKSLSWSKISNILTTPNRYSKILRCTNETKVLVELNLDHVIKKKINTGIYFLDHMLDQICVHSGISMVIDVKGDLHIDDHHTIEDIGITLGAALKESLGNKIGLSRYGFTLPMDESISSCVIDISGRSGLVFKVLFQSKYIGDLNSCMIEHFFYSLSQAMNITLHIYATGKNDHHCCESIFKSFGKTLKKAIKIKNDVLPTSKGYL